MAVPGDPAGRKCTRRSPAAASSQLPRSWFDVFGDTNKNNQKHLFFNAFWLQHGRQNQPKIHPKVMPTAWQQANNEKSKIAQIPCNLQYDRALGYFNLGRKTIKNVPNILPKVASKTMLQIESIWEPTWLHFGKVLAPKLEPNWHQNALTSDPTSQ